MPAATAAQPVEVASRFRLVAMRLSRRLRQQSTGGITPSQLSALATLVRDGRHTTGDLAAAERVQPPTITRIVDALVDAALVERVSDSDDRRVTWVEATPAGLALVEAVRRERDAYLAQRLQTLSPAELTTLDAASTILERMLAEEPR